MVRGPETARMVVRVLAGLAGDLIFLETAPTVDIHLSKGYSKGKGKSHYMFDYEAMDQYFIGKGKSKGKKGKQANWLDAQVWQKGKLKGKGKSQHRPSVNAYHSGMFAGGLEMMDVKDINSSSTTTPSRLNVEQGLIDRGAMASAGLL